MEAKVLQPLLLYKNLHHIRLTVMFQLALTHVKRGKSRSVDAWFGIFKIAVQINCTTLETN